MAMATEHLLEKHQVGIFAAYCFAQFRQHIMAIERAEALVRVDGHNPHMIHGRRLGQAICRAYLTLCTIALSSV